SRSPPPAGVPAPRVPARPAWRRCPWARRSARARPPTPRRRTAPPTPQIRGCAYDPPPLTGREFLHAVPFFRLIADLQIPPVRIEHVKALEVRAYHVGTRVQAAAFELRLHLVGVPRRDAP